MSRPIVLVTGANGFVGRNIVEKIVADGSADVIAGMRKPEAAEWADCDGVEAVQFDLCDPAGMQSLLSNHQPSHVVNCAAYGISPGDRDAGLAYQTNVQGPIELVRACSTIGVQRFVQIGSCWEYGPANSYIKETTPLNPIGIYSSTKASASLLLPEIAKSVGLELIVLRLFGVWGQFEPRGRLVPEIFRAAREEISIDLTDGRQMRDLSYAAEIAATITGLTFADDLMGHKVLNVGTGTGVLVRDFAMRVADELKCSHRLNFGAIPMRADEVPSHVADVTRLKEVLNTLPEPINGDQVKNLILSQRSE